MVITQVYKDPRAKAPINGAVNPIANGKPADPKKDVVASTPKAVDTPIGKVTHLKKSEGTSFLRWAIVAIGVALIAGAALLASGALDPKPTIVVHSDYSRRTPNWDCPDPLGEYTDSCEIQSRQAIYDSYNQRGCTYTIKCRKMFKVPEGGKFNEFADRPENNRINTVSGVRDTIFNKRYKNCHGHFLHTQESCGDKTSVEKALREQGLLTIEAKIEITYA